MGFNILDPPGPLELHQWAWITATCSSFFAIAISFFLIYKHLRYWQQPIVQRYIVRIILMIPIYVVNSLLSLFFRKQAIYLNVARDCYEAYVLFMFFRLLIELAGGEEEMISGLHEVPQMAYSLPFCCFHVKPGRTLLFRCKQMILQFVVVKPILAGATFIMELSHVYEEGSFSPQHGYLYITIIYNFSITISLYFLVLFYEGTKTILHPFKPLSKFLCIKAVIFFAFWQGVVIAGMVHFNFIIKESGDWTIAEVSTAFQNWLICLEMFPLAIAFGRTFGYSSFKEPSFNEGPREDLKMHVVTNFVSVMNVRDVLSDTATSLKKGPPKKIDIKELNAFLVLPKDKQQSLMVYQGYLEKKGEDIAKLWKKRFFIVLKDPAGIVVFPDDPYGIEYQNKPLRPSGWIDFKVVTGVEPRRNRCFKIITPQRIWRLRCRTTDERPQWMNMVIVSCKLKEALPESKDEHVVSLDED